MSMHFLKVIRNSDATQQFKGNFDLEFVIVFLALLECSTVTQDLTVSSTKQYKYKGLYDTENPINDLINLPN